MGKDGASMGRGGVSVWRGGISIGRGRSFVGVDWFTGKSCTVWVSSGVLRPFMFSLCWGGGEE